MSVQKTREDSVPRARLSFVAGKGEIVNRLSEVLLVDDNPLQLKVREAVLRNAGFSVAIATTADSALAILRTFADRIGVMVTDHVMPDHSGSELVRAIRAKNEWLPIIVLSGLPEADVEYRDLDVIFRAKPFPPTELIELVRASLDEATRHRGAA
jgi:DNA-binding response OmpR family regulator